ncbi:tubulin-specific chaperone B, partial [Phenoliferia sp. Uapishka_3]
MSLLTFWVSSPDTHSERRLATDLTILQLKGKLETVTGIPYQSQIVKLQRTAGDNLVGHGGAGEGPGQKEVLAVLDSDDRTLESYGAREWMTLRVDNLDPTSRSTAGQYTDISRVEKFELTTEEYEQRQDTVKAFKERNKLGRFAPTSAPSTPEPQAIIPPDLVPGARCEVALSEELSRRGTVRFVGPTDFGAKHRTTWVGVEWDEPVGKGDGMLTNIRSHRIEGKRYFQTPPLRGSFVKPDKVSVGDYPEIDPFADDDDMEM